MPVDGASHGNDREAACLNCRRSKVKCRKAPGSSRCERCAASGAECHVPEFRVGRAKGVKNKRTGLAKAVHQIEEAIRHGQGSSGDLEELQKWFKQVSGTPSSNLTTSVNEHAPDHEPLQYHDIENPLQLLARATDLQRPSPQDHAGQLPTPGNASNQDVTSPESAVNVFFQPLTVHLDVGESYDPIELGLTTQEEAQRLLLFFHENLAHTRWGLDPSLHTLEFVRSQSSFLLTSLLAAAALFLPECAALAKRLQTHRDWLASVVLSKRMRSVEIVLAFMVNIPWMHPGKHAADDNTGLYIASALSIALDLSLDKIVVPSDFLSNELRRRVSGADCLDAEKALLMDGFSDVSLDSQLGQKLLCRRERAWIALFVLERGICLARGRNFSVPTTSLIKYCDGWLKTPMAQVGDAAMLSTAILRRDLDQLFDTVRSRCDSYRVIDVGSQIAQEIEATIDQFYDKWMTSWSPGADDGYQGLPPYVQILVTHTRLSTYGGVMNHPTAPAEVKRLFRASALSSALNVMRVAIQGEKRLSSMPNNTVIMICFAACVALQLGSIPTATNSQLAPSILNLINETAAVLERIGNITQHRNGASKMYAQYLQGLMQHRALQLQSTSDTNNNAPAHIQPVLDNTTTIYDPALIASAQPNQPALLPDPLDFSIMSDSQIMESVLNMEPDFNAMLPDMLPGNAFDPWMTFMNPPDFGF